VGGAGDGCVENSRVNRKVIRTCRSDRHRPDRTGDIVYTPPEGEPLLRDLSRAIIEDKDRYDRLLQAITPAGAREPWIEFMLGCVERTDIWTTDKVRVIRLLQALTGRVVQERCPTAYSHELVSLLFERPYLRIGNIVDAGLAKRQTAATYARSMVAAGVLEERQAGQAKMLVNTRLMRLLTRDSNTIEEFP
jgi:hypothetical protein